MHKHIQEKKGEKYVNLKHLENISELTSPGFGLLIFFLFGGVFVKESEVILSFWARAGRGMKQEVEECFFTLY